MEDKEIYAEISSIRNLMERSTKFISLNGLSGIMAGVYALAGAALAQYAIQNDSDNFNKYIQDQIQANKGQALFIGVQPERLVLFLFLIAGAVLVLSIATGIFLTIRKAKRKGLSVWNQSSRSFLISGAIPLVTGGCFVLIELYNSHYSIIAPGCLVFYGLALVAAGQYTFGDVKWLGICQIILGLFAALVPGYGLLLWATGFGLLHIIYGTLMHFKYDRDNVAQ